MKKQYCQVIEEYKAAYPDPIRFTKGDILKIEKKESEWSGWVWCINKLEKGRWIPENYLEIHEDTCNVLKDN